MSVVLRINEMKDSWSIVKNWTEKIFSSENPKLPFSFVYGGRQSEDLLSSWKLSKKTNIIDTARTAHLIMLEDPETGLEIIFEAIEYMDFPAVEWLIHIKNGSDRNTPILENIRALDMDFECSEKSGFLLHHNRGNFTNKADYAPLNDLLGYCSFKKLSCVGGRSANGGDFLNRKDGSYPFFNIEYDNGGIIYAIGWSGQWEAEFKRDDKNGLNIQAGMEYTHLMLYPGEKIRTPRILMLFWKAELQNNDYKVTDGAGAKFTFVSKVERNNALNAFKRLILTHYTPLKNGEPVQIPISISSWWGYDQGSGVTEENQIGLIRKYVVENNIPIECYWLDAGWYGEPDKNWCENRGNWYPKESHFPRGLKPVSDEARKHGLGFILWFEPERVAPGTRLYNEHPDWIIKPGKEVLWQVRSIMNIIGGEHKVPGLLNIGMPEVLDWLIEYISATIKENGVTIYRQDCNADPLYYWLDNDLPDRRGMTEIRHIEALYTLWDELVRRHPGLIIDNVAGGARRTDLETISRCITMTRSDYSSEPEGMQCQTFGINQYYPSNMIGSIYSDPYKCRSSYSAGMVYDDTLTSENFNAAEVKKRVEEVKTLRPLYYGDFYPLTEYSIESDVWCAYQLDRKDLNRGAVLIFRREMSPYTTAKFKLGGLDPDSLYELTDIDSGKKMKLAGKILIEEGIEISIALAPCSVIITYRKLTNALY
ncbi:MAG: alpha-galactosidase [Clostridiales bacterium]|nr:alpha-galactosidase [Clostridiales bacterium]